MCKDLSILSLSLEKALIITRAFCLTVITAIWDKPEPKITRKVCPKCLVLVRSDEYVQHIRDCESGKKTE